MLLMVNFYYQFWLQISSFFLFLCLVSPQISLYLIILLFPFQTRSFSYEIGIITLSMFSGGILVLSVSCFYQIIIGRYQFKVSTFFLFLFYFSLFSLLFLFTSPDLIHSGYVYFHTIFLPIIIYFVIRTLIITPNSYTIFKSHLLFTITIAALIEILNFLHSGRRVSTRTTGYDDVDNALILASLFILCIFFLIAYKKKKLLLPILINFSAFIFMISRSYIASFIFSPIYYYFVKRGFGRIIMITIIISTLIFSFSLSRLITDYEYSKIQRRVNSRYRLDKTEKENTFKRLFDSDLWIIRLYGLGSIWRFEMEDIDSYFLIGRGIGVHKLDLASSHNVHIQLFTYFGSIGWILFHITLVLGIPSFRARLPDNELFRKDLYFLIILCGMIYVNGISNGLFHGNFNKVLFLCLGLIHSIQDFKKNINE